MFVKLSILTFVLGTVLLQQQAELPGISWGYAWVFIALIYITWLRFFPERVGPVKIILLLFFLLSGFLWAAIHAHWRLADELPPDWQRRDIRLSGIVASLPQHTDRGVRFLLDVEHVFTDDATAPQRISLTWYAVPSDTSSPAIVRAGERWHLTVRLKQPHGNANPHGFDYEAWALERNIRAIGYVRPSTDNRRLDTLVHRPQYWVEHWRERIQQRFAAMLPDHAYTGILQALATGDQQAVSREQWQTFTRTGTNHLMAISGLHITLVAGLMFSLVHTIWRRIPHLPLRYPAHHAAAAAGMAAAFMYALLSGFAIPAQRAFCMLAVVAVALLLRRRISTTTILAWALLVVTVLDPWATIASGFWLSFGAIAIIMLVTTSRTGRLHGIGSWLRIQGAITIGLIPLLLTLFQQLSLVSPFANAIAIPLVSLLVVPLTLLAAIPLFDFLLPVAHAAVAGVMVILENISAAPHAIWQQHTPPLWTIATAVAGMIWMLLPGGLSIGLLSGFPARWLGLIALLPMFLILPPRPENGALWLTALDVGQGLAVVARTAQHTLLFDTGPGFGETDSGNRIIVPFLRGEGIRRIDRLIVSHADSDHSGGALSVLQTMPVDQLLSSLAERHAVRQAAAGTVLCHAGQRWHWDDVHFEILHPLKEHYAHSQRQPNANNCVLKITTQHGSVLLPADIEARDERALLARAANKLSATVLIAPHHGSQTSSTAAFLQQVNPALTIFTVGYLNRYDHPNQAVLRRYQNHGGQLLRSDHDGAVTVRFENGTWHADGWRTTHRRYWQRQMDARQKTIFPGE